MQRKRYFFDMDGTLAEWRTIQSEEELFQRGYFESLKPNMELIGAAKLLQEEGEDVYILSCYLEESEYALTEKNKWLDTHMPFLPEDKRLFVPYGQDKNTFVEKISNKDLTKDDILIDDYSHNLHLWKGTGVKVMNGINGTKGTWMGMKISTSESALSMLKAISKVA